MSLQQVADMAGFHYKGQESPNPGERSRLWASEDINEVLKENKGTGCSVLESFPLSMLHSLEELNLNDCISLENFSHVVGLGEKLKTMSVRSCTKLRSIPPLKLTSLEELNLSNCTSLQNFVQKQITKSGITCGWKHLVSFATGKDSRVVQSPMLGRIVNIFLVS
ncbi:hypothetical protein P8452_51404 [Trifolium repens]|nr:hypothetical protein P8452_51404 [Trifolium repens]